MRHHWFPSVTRSSTILSSFSHAVTSRMTSSLVKFCSKRLELAPRVEKSLLENLPSWKWKMRLSLERITQLICLVDLVIRAKSYINSRMPSEGSPFTWGSQGEAAFAKFCVCEPQPSATVGNLRTATVRVSAVRLSTVASVS